jgi:photosystem II stability/assembly factor-like uncharacterized protein
MKHILTLAFSFLLSSSYGQWTQMNHPYLQGTYCHDIFVDSSLTLLAASNGVYRSVNHGNDWERQAVGGIGSYIYYPGFAKLNHNPFVLDYTTGQIFYSTDNAATWQVSAMSGLPASPTFYTLHGVEGAMFVEMPSSTFYQSTDGVNWTLTTSCYEIKSDSLVGFFDGSNTGVRNAFGFSKILPDIAGVPPFIDGAQPSGSHVYSFGPGGLYYYDVYSSDPAWTFAGPIPFTIPAYTGFGVTYPFTCHFTDNAILLTLVGESPTGARYTKYYRSTDHGVNWTDIDPAGSDIPVFLIIKQYNDTTLIGNDIALNILYSYDNGASWVQKSSGVISHYQQNLVVMDNCLLLRQIKNMGHRSVPSVMKSVDNGDNWYYVDSGLTLLPNFEYDSASVYGNFDYLFKTGVIAYTGRIEPAYLARSYDEGDSWEEVTLPADPGDLVGWYQGDENSFFVYMASDTLSPDSTIAYNGLMNFYRTNDEGDTWQLVPSIAAFDNHPTSSPVPMQIVGKNDTMLLFHEVYGSGRPVQGYIHRSIDNGNTWTDISGSIFDGEMFASHTNGGGFYIMTGDFGASANEFMVALTWHDTTSATTFWTGPTHDSLYLYQGGSWTHLPGNGLPGGVDIQTLTYNESSGSWNVGTDAGLFYSDDNGQNWQSGVGMLGWSEEVRSSSFPVGLELATLKFRNTSAFVSTQANGVWTNDADISTDIVKQKGNDFVLFPNPAERYVSVISGETVKDAVVDLYDVLGKRVFVKSAVTLIAGEAFQVDLPVLSPGLYYLRISGAGKGMVKKVVIR